MVNIIMEQPGPEVKCEQSEILLTLFGHWFHKLPEVMELFTVKLLAEMLLPDVELLIAVWLKQGLQAGMSSELMLMWERPSVQWIVEEGRRASRRMRRRQGRRNKVESSIVLLSNFLKYFS